MEIIDKVKRFIYDLIAALQKAALYSTAHKIFKDSMDTTYQSLQEVFKERDELIMGIISGEMVFEKEIFFELSTFDLTKKMLVFFQERSIDRIVFYPALTKNELEAFILLLINIQKEAIKADLKEYMGIRGIKNIAVGRIKTPGRETIEEVPSEISIYENYASNSFGSLEAILNNETLDSFTIKIGMMEIMDSLYSRHSEILKLMAIKRHDVPTYSHMINVSILAMYFSSKLGFSKNDILDISIAAMFHDIGKIYITERILNKEDKLAEGELASIRNHAELGAEMLLKYVDKLGILPVLVSFEHHLRYDLKGYPKLPFKYKPHIASSIVSICDVYDALYQRRSYKRDYPPDTIYNIMIREKGSAFDPGLLDNFFRMIGIWPIGTVVLLNDGRVAVVREENEDDIFVPKIEVIYPQDKKEVIDLKYRKAELRIERALNPFAEGKDYLSLI